MGRKCNQCHKTSRFMISAQMLAAGIISLGAGASNPTPALKILLADGAPIENVISASESLEQVANSEWDLSELRKEVELQSKVNDFSDLRILVLVDAVGKSGIREAAPLLIERIENRPSSHQRYEQFTAHDVRAFESLKAKLNPALRDELRTRAETALLKNFMVTPNDGGMKAGAVYAIATLRPASKTVMRFFRSQFSSIYREVVHAAVFRFIDNADVPAIREAWESADVQIREDIRVEFADALLISDKRANPELESLFHQASAHDSSPVVREKMKKIVDANRSNHEFEELIKILTPEQRKSICTSLLS